jgi:PIN domain nuclease of toxin-antitoxin system
MRVLLDTHILLWYQAADKTLSPNARAVIESDDNDSVVSIVSFWEIGIKHSIGKLPLRMPLNDFFLTIQDAGFPLLGLQREHILSAAVLPHLHRDPFDRMLIAQAKQEGMHLLAADPHFKLYDVPLVDL